MKKVLILAALVAFAGTTVMAEETVATPDCPKPPCKVQLKKMPPKHKVDFDKKLKLTDEQKAQAKELREKGVEQIKPLVEQSKAKRDELKKAIDANKDYKTVENLKKEVRDTDKQIHEIHRQNMKDFENILTSKQKKELEKIKKEGRKKFEKEHKNKHPFPPKGEFKPQVVLP